MLPSEIPKLPTDPLVRGFPDVWKVLLFYNSLFRRVSVPNSFVSLFIFYLLSYLLSKTMGCLCGCLMSSASIQSVVLWNLLRIQMFFQWICRGESGLSVLSLCHLRTSSQRIDLDTGTSWGLFWDRSPLSELFQYSGAGSAVQSRGWISRVWFWC